MTLDELIDKLQKIRTEKNKNDEVFVGDECEEIDNISEEIWSNGTRYIYIYWS